MQGHGERGSLLVARKYLEPRGRDDGGCMTLSPSLAISVAEVLFVFFFLVPGPELASCA